MYGGKRWAGDITGELEWLRGIDYEHVAWSAQSTDLWSNCNGQKYEQVRVKYSIYLLNLTQ